jgi:hypothetical protein
MRWEKTGDKTDHGLMVGKWQLGECKQRAFGRWCGKVFLPMGKEIVLDFFATEEEARAFVEGKCRYWIAKLNEGMEE